MTKYDLHPFLPEHLNLVPLERPLYPVPLQQLSVWQCPSEHPRTFLYLSDCHLPFVSLLHAFKVCVKDHFVVDVLQISQK